MESRKYLIHSGNSYSGDEVGYCTGNSTDTRENVYGIIENSLKAVGRNYTMFVVRVQISRMSHAGGFIRAHGDKFKGNNPALTAVTAELSQDGMVVEIDVDGIIPTNPEPSQLINPLMKKVDAN